ncbi:hypothetical protein WN50_20000 [Limnoraphis robusta CS-951]|uniref:Uncharacterized protein n=2 Tax=Limnoraphis TaxID=1332112 RepID=A0A0F5YCA3_9CYAN|nr:hypothetical protein WN50_20000 [Limnoraphis robusta CS-951]
MAVSSSTTKRRTTRTRPTTGKRMSKGEEDTVNAENTDENNQEKDMSKDLEVDTKPTKAQSSENSTPTQIQVAHSAMIMPNRPIEESHLEVVGTIMGNRPIFKTESVSGISFVHSEDSVGAMANRPVAISHLQITSMTVNRPVASNDVDDPYALMGYLD